MKTIYIIILFFCSSCLNLKKIGTDYCSGSDFFSFDLDNNKYYYVEKKPNSFYNYSEGSLFMDQHRLYLKSFNIDSCIKSTIFYNSKGSELMIVCQNYDPRFKILYELNGIAREGLNDGSLKINFIKGLIVR